MSQKKITLYATITAIILAVFVWFIWKYFNSPKNTLGSFSSDLNVGVQSPEAEKEANAFGTDALTYTDQKYAISFKYPKNFKVSSIPNEDGDSIVVQNIETKLGFQIDVTPFDESGSVLTKERIEHDIHNLKVENPQAITIAGSSGGIAFISDDGGTKNREVWFAYNGNLYQMSTPISQDVLLQKILGTWQFVK
jgi:hypothetical protein